MRAPEADKDTSMDKPNITLGTPYRWLGDALALCRKHPAAFMGAASVMLVVGLLPTILQRVAASILPQTLLLQALVYSLFSLLLLPPITGGFYRLAHAAWQGKAVTLFDVFTVLSDGPAARRLVGTNLAFFFLLLLCVAAPVMALGGPQLVTYLTALGNLQQGATALPVMPSGLAPLLVGAAIVTLLINTAKELAMAQASLGERTPLAATGDGFKVALRNAGAFVLFYLPVALLAFLGFMAFALVAVLIGAVLSLISPMLTYLLIVPVAVLVGLAYYAIVFAFFYHAWRDTLAPEGLEKVEATAPAAHQIEA